MFKNRRAVILILFIACIAAGFWLASRYPALSSKAAMSGAGQFEDPLTHEAHFHIPHKAPLYEKIFYTTLNWYETNWRGMTFGLAIAAGFLTLLSYLPKKSTEKRLKNSFMGMLVGTPLGVCVNCVAPIAKGLYEAGSKMETALAVMFSSPTLNIVVLTMLFTIFPFYMAVLKLAATFILILLIVPFISKKSPAPAARLPVDAVCDIESADPSWSDALSSAAKDYWKSLQYIVIRTVPLMLLAGFLGAALSHLWSFELLIGLKPTLVNLSFVSFMGTFLPLPIVFDIMLAQALMVSGLPSGFVMASLFTFGTFSIYSAMIVYRTFSLKLAVQLYVIVCLMGIGLGYAADHYSEYLHIQWLTQYDKIMTEPPDKPRAALSREDSAVPEDAANPLSHPATVRETEPFFNKEAVSVEFVPHATRNNKGGKPFSRFSGSDYGIAYSNHLTPENFFDPLFFGRGIASGDIDRDGWTDIAVATENGFEVYRNVEGKAFRKLELPNNESAGMQTVNIALVDLNNDGWLDVFYSTYGEGNYLWLNPLAGKEGGRTVRVPNNNALITSASAFADLNGDGFLDIVNGNYFLGILTRTPMDNSIDQLVINRGLVFSIEDLEGIPGQTHSALFSDINQDSVTDLVIGNDYRVADTYYLGNEGGGFKKITKGEGTVPITTENTMSVDTGDINNDLVPDIYLANIGFTKGIDVVSNIFGDAMQETGRQFCDSGESILEKATCHKLLHLVTLLNPEKQDISERCTLLASGKETRDCMVTRMALLAARKNDESLCGRISKGHDMGYNLCKNYFRAGTLDFDSEEEIPLRPMSNVLLQGSKEFRFEDVSEKNNVTTAEWSWNAKFADLDNDEWQDLYVVNGVLITQEFATNNFFRNLEGKQFVAAEKEFGLYDRDHSSSYTYIDIDNDGDLDIISNTLYGPFKVYINNETKNNSVTFKLRDAKGNRFCVGCRITVHYGRDGSRKQFREIKAGGGFHSYDAPMAHFGLGGFDSLSHLEIRWSTGETTVIDRPLPANREYRIERRGTGERKVQ